MSTWLSGRAHRTIYDLLLLSVVYVSSLIGVLVLAVGAELIGARNCFIVTWTPSVPLDRYASSSSEGANFNIGRDIPTSFAGVGSS